MKLHKSRIKTWAGFLMGLFVLVPPTLSFAQFDGGTSVPNTTPTAVLDGSRQSAGQMDAGVSASRAYQQSCIGDDMPIRGSFVFAQNGVYRRIVCTGDFAAILEPRIASERRFVLAEVVGVNPSNLDLTLRVVRNNDPHVTGYVGAPLVRNLHSSAQDLRFSRDFGGGWEPRWATPSGWELQNSRTVGTLPSMGETIVVGDCPIGYTRGSNLHLHTETSSEWRDGCRGSFVRDFINRGYRFQPHPAERGILVMKFHSLSQDDAGRFFASVCLWKRYRGGFDFFQCDRVARPPLFIWGGSD